MIAMAHSKDMSASVGCRKKSQVYGLILFFLTALFCFRVLAQLVQIWHPVGFLPSFEAWHSGALPYWLLVCAQGLIILFCLNISWQIFRGTVSPSSRKGKVWLVLGSLYFAVMTVRLIAGLTVSSDHFWFGAKLPTVFHLVLSTFLLVHGYFHFQESRQLGSRGKEASA